MDFERIRSFVIGAIPDLPEAKVMFAGNKTFYFDVGTNRYGVFLRISELRSRYRTAVTIPEHHWARFRDIVNEIASSKSDSDKSGEPSTGGDKVNGASGSEELSESGDKSRTAKPAVNSAPEPSAIPVA